MAEASEERIISSEAEEVLEEENEELSFIRRNVPIRNILTLMGFLCFVLLNLLRVSMSVAIVSMVDWKSITTNASSGNMTCSYTENLTRSPDEDGHFKWKPPIQGHILACYFYGLLVTECFGGYIAEKVSAKYVLLVGTIMSSLGTILIPVTASKYAHSVMFLQILKGLGQGFIIPAFSVLMSKWIPKSERFRSMCLIGSGIPLGGFLGIAVAGVICKAESLGWPYVFYIYGGVGLIWCFFWIILIYESPLTHPYITHQELLRILKSQTIMPVKQPIPLKYIMKSGPVWAYVAVGFASIWSLSIYTTVIPLFMSTVLKFNIEMNGVMSSLPHLLEMMVFILSCVLMDNVTKKTASYTTVHKISISIGLGGFAICMIAVTFTACDRFITVIILTLGLGLCGMCFASTSIVPLEMSPRFAGVISAVMNTIGTLSGIIVPTLIGYLTKEKRSIDEWNVLFYLSAVIAILAVLFFNLWGSSKMQKWDAPTFHHPEASQEEELVVQMEETPDGGMQIHLTQPGTPPDEDIKKKPVFEKDTAGPSDHSREKDTAGPSNQSREMPDDTTPKENLSKERPWRTASFDKLSSKPEPKIVLQL